MVVKNEIDMQEVKNNLLVMINSYQYGNDVDNKHKRKVKYFLISHCISLILTVGVIALSVVYCSKDVEDMLPQTVVFTLLALILIWVIQSFIVGIILSYKNKSLLRSILSKSDSYTSILSLIDLMIKSYSGLCKDFFISDLSSLQTTIHAYNSIVAENGDIELNVNLDDDKEVNDDTLVFTAWDGIKFIPCVRSDEESTCEYCGVDLRNTKKYPTFLNTGVCCERCSKLFVFTNKNLYKYITANDTSALSLAISHLSEELKTRA